MKVKILLGCLLISGLTLALENTEASYEKMNKKYQSLAKREEVLYQKKEKAAIEASTKLDEQKALYSRLSKERENLETLEDTRYYKKQYKTVMKEMDIVLEELEGKIAANEVVVDDFNTLKSIREID